MNHFATIITTDHVDKALVLLDSLKTFGDATLHALIVDYKPRTATQLGTIEDFKAYDLQELLENVGEGVIARIIANKYANQIDELRWALKSPFISVLRKTNPTICYVDCDLCFYNDYQFLIDKLSTTSILLTPHWREINPITIDFLYNFKHGIYNAGFIGFGNNCEKMLEWWAEMCAIECTKSDRAFTYTDQRYLDLVPIYFENVEVLRHYGCNIAAWNSAYLQRERKNEQTEIRGMPIVFIHFSPITILNIENGRDNNLYDYYNHYRMALRQTRQKLIGLGLKDCTSKPIEDQIL